MKQRGQTLVLFAALLIVFLAFTALVLDGGIYLWRWQSLQVDLDAACLAASLSQSAGDSEYGAFVGSLQSNGVESFYYEPYEVGADGLVIRGLQWHLNGESFFSGLQGPHEFYLAQFMGITSMDLAVRSRCTIPKLRTLPIAVQEPWVIQGVGNPSFVYPILGQGAEAVNAQGSDFRDAVLPQVWCDNTNCDPRLFFEPATEVNSPDVLKDIWRDTVLGTAGSPLVPIGGRIPQIGGVSSHFLTQAMVDARYEIGDQIIVMVYNGTVDTPEPGYGDWENVQVIYYAIAEITEITPNSIYAYFVEAPITLLDEVLSLTTPRTVPWDWLGPLP